MLLNTGTGATPIIAQVGQTVAELKAELGIVGSLQAGFLCLRDDALVSEYNLGPDDVIAVVDALVGGGKKRKKKKYTTPKRKPHVHKKVKLRVLKYYKITGDGKVSRLRVECPSPTCGHGYFMAKHANRMHCGYCSTSLVQQQK